MIDNFSITVTTTDKQEFNWGFTHMTFSDGAEQIRLNECIIRRPFISGVSVQARLDSSQAVMTLALLKNAIREWFIHDDVVRMPLVDLTIRYLPYARQDRVCYPGEANGSRVFAEMVNAMGFASITVIDPHSQAAVANLAYPRFITQTDIFTQHEAVIGNFIREDFVVCGPDKGSTLKAQYVSANFNGTMDIIQGDKIRSPDTGELTGFSYEGDVEGKTVLIVDDICDGGGTFLGLAAELHKGGADRVGLYITHGIFSKGLAPLLSGGIDFIITTNTLDQPVAERSSKVLILKV